MPAWLASGPHESVIRGDDRFNSWLLRSSHMKDEARAQTLNVTRALPPVVWSARGSGDRTNYIT